MIDGYVERCIEAAERELLRATGTVTIARDAMEAIVKEARGHVEDEKFDEWWISSQSWISSELLKKAVADGTVRDLETLNTWIAANETNDPEEPAGPIGDYDVVTFRGRDAASLDRGTVSHRGKVLAYPRKALHVWNLIARAVAAAARYR